MIKVMKFGGTSVGSVDAMLRTADIIRGEPNSKVVVVSAMSGVTNALIGMMRESEPKAEASLRQLAQRHLETARATMCEAEFAEYAPLLKQRVDGLRDRLKAYHQAPRGHGEGALRYHLQLGREVVLAHHGPHTALPRRATPWP